MGATSKSDMFSKLHISAVVALMLTASAYFGAAVATSADPARSIAPTLGLVLLAVGLSLRHRHTHYLLFALVLLVPLSEVIRIAGEAATLLPVTGVLIAGLWLVSVMTYKVTVQPFPELKWLVAYGLLAMISTALGLRPANIRTLFTALQLLVLAFLVVQLCQEPKTALSLGQFMVLGTMLIAVTVLAAGLNLPGLRGNIREYQVLDETLYRASSFAAGINSTSSLLVIGIALSAIYARQAQKSNRALMSGCFVVLWLANLLTYSITGAIAGVFVTGLAFSDFLLDTRPRRVLLMLVTVALCITVVAGVAPDLLGKRVFPRAKLAIDTGDPRLFSIRFAAWAGAIKVILRNPLLGVGINNTQYLVPQYWSLAWNDRRAAHNTYLSVGGDLGVPALLVFLLLFVGSFARLRRHLFAIKEQSNGDHSRRVDTDRHALVATGKAVLTAMAGAGVYALALDLERLRLLWVLLGLCLAVNQLFAQHLTETANKQPLAETE